MTPETYGIAQLVALIAIAGLGWRYAVSMETRIRDDADKAHKTIGENIDTLRQEIHRDIGEIRQDIRDLRSDVQELNTRVSRVEGKLGLPSERT